MNLAYQCLWKLYVSLVSFFRSASSPWRNAWHHHRCLLSSHLQKCLVLILCSLKFASCLFCEKASFVLLRSATSLARTAPLRMCSYGVSSRSLRPLFTFLQSTPSSRTTLHSFECVTLEDASSPVIGPLSFHLCSLVCTQVTSSASAKNNVTCGALRLLCLAGALPIPS